DGENLDKMKEKGVSKSSVVTTADAPNQRQQHKTPLNNHSTTDPTCHVPTLAPTATSTENMNQAEMIAEIDQVADDEFINIFCTPVQVQGEMSSRHVDSSNMHTFYQHHPSEHRWTKDHPLEQVIRNHSQSVRTRRQLEVFNKRTRVIVETIHVNFDELPHMASDHQHITPLNTQTKPEPTCQVLIQASTVASTENINQAEMITENAPVGNDEFINIFYTPVQDRGETSTRHVDSSNMHTFYQHHPSEHRWTKD
nr:hypothetical protein [Tanacetum cinerariifolium]